MPILSAISSTYEPRRATTGERARDDCLRSRVWSDIRSRPVMSTPPGSLAVLRSRRAFAIAAGACLVLWLGALGVASEQVAPASRPNIILMFPDNLGWGEVNVYGGVRGAITPRLDRLAAEGLRLNNFNVEFSCTVSRAALMTGRYAVRTGATQGAGITLWEVTIAEALRSIGYATGLFGKWHLGGDRPENRNPSQQGFDEYYGVPRTSNEAQTTIAHNDRVLVRRQRRRRPAAVARIVGPLVGFLQQRHGGRHPDAVPGPVAGETAGGPRHERAGARNRFLPDHRRRGRRGYRPARSRDRRDPSRVPRSPPTCRP